MNITGNVLKHAQHIEDGIVFSKDNAELSYKTLESVFETLKGNTPDGVKVSTKVDGAPSVACASNFHGKTFVCYKSALEKIVEPPINKKTGLPTEPDLTKICYTEADCDRVFAGEEKAGMRDKMKALMRHAKTIGIPKDEIWQGDFMFSKEDIYYQTFDGEERLCFHPNTLIYTIALDDPLAEQFKNAENCVIWHTKYVGEDFGNLHISFNVDVDNLENDDKSFLSLDANIHNIAGQVTLTDDETTVCMNALSKIRNDLNVIENNDVYNIICNTKVFKDNLLSFMNALIKSPLKVQFTPNYIEKFVDWMDRSFDKNIEEKKTEKAKQDWRDKKSAFEKFVFDNRETFESIIELQKLMVSVKELFEKKLNNIPQRYKNYVQYKSTGTIIPVGQEGFCVSDIDGNLQKIVSRLSFSLNNFDPDILKGWESDRRYNKTSTITESSDSMVTSINAKKINAPNVVKNVALKNLNVNDSIKDEISNQIITDIAQKIDDTDIQIQVKKDESPASKRGRGEIKLNVEPIEKINREVISNDIYSALKVSSSDLNVTGLKKGYGGAHKDTPVMELSYDMDSWEKRIYANLGIKPSNLEDINVELRFKPKTGMANASITTRYEEEGQALAIYKYQPYMYDGEITDDMISSLLNDNLDKSNWIPSIKVIAQNVFDEYMKKGVKYFTFRGDFVPSNEDGTTHFKKSLHTLINEAFKVVNQNKKKYGLTDIYTSKDSWNPSDIYICSEVMSDSKPTYDTFVKEWTDALKVGYTDYSPFNVILRKYFNSYDIIGISLKKLNNGRISISERENFSLEKWGPRRIVLRDRLNLIDNLIYIPDLVLADNPNQNGSGLSMKLIYGNNLRYKQKIENAYNNQVVVTCAYRSFSGSVSDYMSFETHDNYSMAQNGKLSNILLKNMLNKYIDYTNFSEADFEFETLPIFNTVAMEKLNKAVKYITDCDNISVRYIKSGKLLSYNDWINFVENVKKNYSNKIISNNRLNDWPKIIKFILALCSASELNYPEDNISLKDLICDLYYGSKKIGDEYAPFIKIC